MPYEHLNGLRLAFGVYRKFENNPRPQLLSIWGTEKNYKFGGDWDGEEGEALWREECRVLSGRSKGEESIVGGWEGFPDFWTWWRPLPHEHDYHVSIPSTAMLQATQNE